LVSLKIFDGFSISFNSRICFFLASAFYIKKLTTVKNILIFIDCLLQHILSFNIIKGTHHHVSGRFKASAASLLLDDPYWNCCTDLCPTWKIWKIVTSEVFNFQHFDSLNDSQLFVNE